MSLKNNAIIQSEIISLTKHTFRGGIHPPQQKRLSNQASIDTLACSAKLVIPLQQNSGSASIAYVKTGDKVVTDQLIAVCSNGTGANIHSPVNGEVVAIKPCPTGHPSGLLKPAIIIQTSTDWAPKSNYSSAELNEQLDWKIETQQSLLDKIKQAGIVGLGGATFPTDIKLANKSEQEIDTLIVNAMECEPYITCDDRLLREFALQVIEGAQVAAFIAGAKNIIFAIEDNKPQAIESLEIAIKQFNAQAKTSTDTNNKNLINMRIMVAPTKYPNGGEKQTIELVLGKQIPKGKLPAFIGVLVQNTATLFSIYQAVAKNKKLTNRLVTITGDLVNNPGNYWIDFGTPIEHIIQALNIPKVNCGKIIFGGPLMGHNITELNTPVTKSTNCIIFNQEANQDKSWLTEDKPHQECIRCSDCEKVCPVDLLPQQLYWFSQSEQWDSLEKQELYDCIECGACAYVCPSEIPLVHYFRFGKSAIKNNNLKQKNADNAKRRFEFREKRLQAAKDERALKHQKAAEARKTSAENKLQDPGGKQNAISQALERVKQKKASQLKQAELGKDKNE